MFFLAIAIIIILRNFKFLKIKIDYLVYSYIISINKWKNLKKQRKFMIYL